MSDSNSWSEDVALVHVLAQYDYHDTARIIGNRTGLLKLKEAIEKALEHGCECAPVMANDGEGYLLFVHDVKSSYFDKIPYGYTADYAKDGRDIPDEIHSDENERIIQLKGNP